MADPAGTPLTDAKRRLMERLKTVDSATAPELAAEFRLTDTAVRQHLDALEAAGLVARAAAPPTGRGRPPVRWHLTALAGELFPNRHGDLTAELLTAIREEYGEAGVRRVLATRATMQLDHYRSALPAIAPVRERAQRLAELRTAEGYMAEVLPEDCDGTIVLVEHHCPISGAAGSCGGLCDAELSVFGDALGPGVEVQRTQHLLGGDRRCAYRIVPTTDTGTAPAATAPGMATPGVAAPGTTTPAATAPGMAVPAMAPPALAAGGGDDARGVAGDGAATDPTRAIRSDPAPTHAL